MLIAIFDLVGPGGVEPPLYPPFTRPPLIFCRATRNRTGAIPTPRVRTAIIRWPVERWAGKRVRTTAIRWPGLICMKLFSFMQGFNAFGAGPYPFARSQFSPLQISFGFFPANRIIFTSHFFACYTVFIRFPANRAASHRISYNYKLKIESLLKLTTGIY